MLPAVLHERGGHRILDFNKEHGGWVRMQFDKELDARGLNCPLPILRTKKSLNDMSSGQVLRVIATDPGAVKDFQAFSRQTGNELLSSETVSNEFVFFMKKK
jgi:tRNA 2-thiouridine synthesizing protein A